MIPINHIKTESSDEPNAQQRNYAEVVRNKNLCYRFWKRFFDVVLSVLALIFLSPVFLITAVLIVREDGFPVIFSQERTGLNGKVFRMYKFRSMCRDASQMHKDLLERNEMDGPVFKMRHDPRVTKVGQFIRRTSIDELPQLVNVIKGEMSIVGPRPIVTYEAARFSDYENQRHLVKPGLTCYWQVSGRNDTSFSEWMEMDLRYIRDASLWTDFKLICLTFGVILSGGRLLAQIVANKKAFRNWTKRFFDFILSLCASIVLALPIIVISVIIIIMDFGNPFYVSTRVGYGGKNIGVLKFRSMKSGADNLERHLTLAQIVEYKKEYKLKDDPRLIGYKKAGDGKQCFGAFLRRSSLDELPQIFWNICFKGNMSLVGPRPILREELEKYYTDDERRRLLSVKPGLTGLWQVSGRSHCTYENGQRQKVELSYIERESLWLDVVILFKTLVVVLSRKGAQ